MNKFISTMTLTMLYLCLFLSINTVWSNKGIVVTNKNKHITQNTMPLRLHEAQDNLAQAYQRYYGQPTFWRNISHLPSWWPDNSLSYHLSSGWYRLNTHKTKSALIKVPAYTALLAIDKKYPAPALSLSWSRGDGLFTPTAWHPQSDSTHKVVFNDSGQTAYLRLQWLSSQKASQSRYNPALFLAEADATHWLDYNRSVRLPLPSYRIKRTPGGDYHQGYQLNPNKKVSVTIIGPTRLQVNPRLIYNANQSDHWRQMTLHWQLNDAPETRLAQQTTMDYRYAYTINGETLGLSQANQFWIDIKPGIHTLHLRSDQPLLLDIYQLDETMNLLPELNGLSLLPSAIIDRLSHTDTACQYLIKQTQRRACGVPPSLTIDHQQKELWRTHAQTMAFTQRYFDLYPTGTDFALQQQTYQTIKISALWPTAQTPYLTEGQRTRQAQKSTMARFASLPKGNPQIRYQLPPRQQASRIRLLLPLLETPQQQISLRMDDGKPIILEWFRDALSPEAKQESLSSMAKQQLGLKNNDAPWVAVAELPLPAQVNHIDIAFLNEQSSNPKIALQFRDINAINLSESDYLNLISQQPNTLASWTALLNNTPPFLPQALLTQWQPSVNHIINAAAVFRHNIAKPAHPSSDTSLTLAEAEEQWQQAQAQALQENLLGALKRLEPLIKKSPQEWQRKAILQRIQWLEALGDINLANQLRKQEILYSTDETLRTQLVAQLQQRLQAVSNWQGLYSLYAALLLQSPFNNRDQGFHNKTQTNTCLKNDWLCLLAETRLRQGDAKTAIHGFLLLPDYRKPAAWLVESAYKLHWQKTFSTYIAKLPKAAQDFWHSYRQHHLGLSPPQQAYWPIPGENFAETVPLQWQSLDKEAAQNSAIVGLRTSANTVFHQRLMHPEKSINVSIQGPQLIRIGYRAVHASNRLDERNDWLTLTDNHKTLQAPLFHSQQLSALTPIKEPIQVGISKYLYYQLPAGHHELQLSSAKKPWLVDLRMAQQPFLSTDAISQNGLHPYPVNLKQPPKNRYQEAVNALWQVEVKGRQAAQNMPLFSSTMIDMNTQYEEKIALLAIQKRLQKNIFWQPLRYVDGSAGQQSTPITSWQPESPAWQIRHILSGSQTLPNSVLTDHKSLLIDLYNRYAGEYRLAVHAYHLPQSVFEPMHIKISGSQQPKTIDLNQPGTRWIPLQLKSGQQHLRIQNLTPHTNQWLSVKLQHKNAQGHWQTLSQEKHRKFHLATAKQPVEISLKGPALLRIHSQTDALEKQVRYQHISSGWQTVYLTHTVKKGKQTAYRIFVYKDKTNEQSPAPLLKPAATQVIAPPLAISPLATKPAVAFNRDWPPLPSAYQIPGSFHVRTGAFQRRLLEEDSNVDPERFVELNLQYRFKDRYRQQYWRTEILWRTARQAGKDVLGFKQRWDWLPARKNLALGTQLAFYWQGLNVPLTDMTDYDWAASGYFSGYIAKRQTLSDQLSHTMKATFFSRWFGLENLPPALRAPVDQDIYSQYKNDHLYGLHLSERMNYTLWADARAYTTLSLSTNEDFNPLNADVYRMDLGWQQLFQHTSVDIGYRLQYFTADKHREEDVFKPQIRLKLNWHHHRIAQFGWHIGLQYTLDQQSGAGAFGLTLSNNLDHGAVYDDYLPGEIDFAKSRLRNFRQQSLPVSQPAPLKSL